MEKLQDFNQHGKCKYAGRKPRCSDGKETAYDHVQKNNYEEIPEKRTNERISHKKSNKNLKEQ